jgi:hypothetical protein
MNFKKHIVFSGIFTFCSIFLFGNSNFSISPKIASHAGTLIWKNECGGKIQGLTSWNVGEDFASLGIGHFIWYPNGQKGPFEEMFPSLIAYLQKMDCQVPSWLLSAKGCPWNSREQFNANLNSPQMNELRQFLANTISQQALFIAQRLEKTLPRLTSNLSDEKKDHVLLQFNYLASQSQGLYALLDYVNFKGEGISPKETYKGKGWGLLQVLEVMPLSTKKEDSLKNFILSAKSILAQRVENSPPERNEKKWLQGWYNRIDSYAGREL